jgi:hypothetical protein
MRGSACRRCRVSCGLTACGCVFWCCPAHCAASRCLWWRAQPLGRSWWPMAGRGSTPSPSQRPRQQATYRLVVNSCFAGQRACRGHGLQRGSRRRLWLGQRGRTVCGASADPAAGGSSGDGLLRAGKDTRCWGLPPASDRSIHTLIHLIPCLAASTSSPLCHSSRRARLWTSRSPTAAPRRPGLAARPAVRASTGCTSIRGPC